MSAVREVSRRTGCRYVILTTGIVNGPGVIDCCQRAAESTEGEEQGILGEESEAANQEVEPSDDGPSGTRQQFDEQQLYGDSEGTGLRMCRPNNRGCKPGCLIS